MAKKKAKKLGLFGLIFMLASIVGLVLAVVGLCIDFFESSITIGETRSSGMGLFEDYSIIEATMDGDMTIVLVQVFAIVSLVLTALGCLITVCGSLGIVRVGGLAKILGAALVVPCCLQNSNNPLLKKGLRFGTALFCYSCVSSAPSFFSFPFTRRSHAVNVRQSSANCLWSASAVMMNASTAMSRYIGMKYHISGVNGSPVARSPMNTSGVKKSITGTIKPNCSMGWKSQQGL